MVPLRRSITPKSLGRATGENTLTITIFFLTTAVGQIYTVNVHGHPVPPVSLLGVRPKNAIGGSK